MILIGDHELLPSSSSSSSSIFLPVEHGSNGLMRKLGFLIAAGLAVASVAAAQDRIAATPEGAERFWVQERPLSAQVAG